MAHTFLCGWLVVAILGWCSSVAAQANDSFVLYVGTYTSAGSQGIYRMRLNATTGELTPMGAPTTAVNPSFIAIAPSQKLLYAVSEVSDFEGQKTGGVAAYRIEANGELTELNRQASGGRGPCHLVVDRTGNHVLVANYGGGSVAVLPIGDDGKLQPISSLRQHEGSSVNPQRQEGPHAHSINLDRENRYAYAADLGLDTIFTYAFDSAEGVLRTSSAVKVAPGAGPRHFALHPSQPWAFSINELNSTITSFRIAADGALQAMASVSTLPADFQGKSYTAEVLVHPSGKFLYGSNRGHDSIAVFEIEGQSGALQRVGVYSTRGKTPRNFRIDPSGQFLLAANQGSDAIEVFRIDQESGALEHTGHRAQAPTPVCIRFLK